MRYNDTWDAPRYDNECSYVWKDASEVLAWLNPQAGEKILDVGSGTGHLAGKIAASGAHVLGIDTSPMMIGQAMWNFPKISFLLGDARTFMSPEPFDAVFSNAVFHWIPDLEKAFVSLHQALVPGGRLVAEMGTAGNIAQMMTAFFAEGAAYGLAPTEVPWRFQDPEVTRRQLETAGFQVEKWEVVERNTPLSSGTKGLRRWFEVYLPGLLDRLPAGSRDTFFEGVENRLRDSLFSGGLWHADYKRLRFLARKRTE